MRSAAVALVVLLVAIVGTVAVLAGGLLPDNQSTPRPSATVRRVSPPPPPPPTPTPVRTPIDDSITASAVVVPRRSADLAMPISGRVVTVAVSEEDEVFTGELLVRVDPSTRQAAVEVARAAMERGEAAVDRARIQLEQLPDDASAAQQDSAEADLRLAEAEMQVARTTLVEAELALTETELRAPFGGTVAWVGVAVGEQAVAGQPLISLGDLSGWFIRTIDLSELNVVRLAVGDRAEVTFEALPGRVLSGVVDQIQVRGSSQESGVRFDVFIRPDEHHPELRWNMSATVRITPAD